MVVYELFIKLFMGDMAAHTHKHTNTDLEEIREQFDSLDNLFYGKLWCHQSMKHMAVAQRLERPQ